jgi:hypothetical protein
MKNKIRRCGPPSTVILLLRQNGELLRSIAAPRHARTNALLHSLVAGASVAPEMDVSSSWLAPQAYTISRRDSSSLER